jgi:hypothetical protein
MIEVCIYVHKCDPFSSIDQNDKMLTNQQSQADSCKNKDLDVHHASSIILGDTSSTGGGGGIKRSRIRLMTDWG